MIADTFQRVQSPSFETCNLFVIYNIIILVCLSEMLSMVYNHVLLAVLLTHQNLCSYYF